MGWKFAATSRRLPTMPFPVTRREKLILAVVALLIVLGLAGMALL